MLLAPSPVQGITRFLLVAILLVAPGCLGPIVTRAPFPQRPESVKRGSRLGPFEGRVLDADTQKPLEKTRIWCSWAFNRGIGTPAPEATRSFETVTDPDGHYLVPRLKTLPLGLSTRLAHFTLIAYRRGYVAYRHEWRFSAPGRHRRDFSQLANVIRLTRWSSELSHAKHWLYLGGPPSIRSMSPKDLLAAAADLAAASHRPRQATARAASQSPHPRPRKGLASRILLSDDVRQITGYAGTLRGLSLTDPGDATSTWHLRAVDKPERYDVAVRVWRLSGSALTHRYEKLLGSLPGSRQLPIQGDRSFVISQGEILGLGFLSQSASSLVLITCGRGQCTTDKQLQKIAGKVAKHLNTISTHSPLGK